MIKNLKLKTKIIYFFLAIIIFFMFFIHVKGSEEHEIILKTHNLKLGIENILNSDPHEKLVIIIPNGEYEVDYSIPINRPNVVIRGDGEVKITQTIDTDLFYIHNTNNVIIDNLIIDYFENNIDGSPVKFSGVDSSSIINSTIYGSDKSFAVDFSGP